MPHTSIWPNGATECCSSPENQETVPSGTVTLAGSQCRGLSSTAPRGTLALLLPSAICRPIACPKVPVPEISGLPSPAPCLLVHSPRTTCPPPPVAQNCSAPSPHQVCLGKKVDHWAVEEGAGHPGEGILGQRGGTVAKAWLGQGDQKEKKA